MELTRISDKEIGVTNRPFIIAELSGNHNRSLDRALAMVKAAARCGVDAIKLQTYKPDTMTVNSDASEFVIHDAGSPWYGKNLYQLYEQAYTPWEWHETIFEEAKKQGLIAFSSPFDLTAVDFLESLNVPAYKISSFELTDLGLIRRVAQTGKLVIISTGMATLAEIDECVRTCRQEGNNNLILLKCTSTYPANPADSNLLTIQNMQQLFSCPVGLSDHTLGIGVAVAAVALGARVIEKHFVLDRSGGGVDATFSLEPEEMKNLVLEVDRAWQSLGKINYGTVGEEKNSLKYRRSIYVMENMKKGDLLSEENIRSLRPALGIPVKYMDLLLGRQVKRDIDNGTPLTWDMVI